MANSLFPAFVRMFYHTAFGQHVQTVPTLAWNPGLGTNGAGGYFNWDDDPVDAVDMVTALATELADFQPSTGIYDSAVIYTMFDEFSTPVPQAAFDLALAGTAVTADVPASQTTITVRTSAFGIAKLEWFDATPSTDFLPLRALPGSGQPLDLFNVWTDTAWAWAGRDGFRPATFMQVSYTLSEALRKQYRLN
jgi:hypothetical protein